MHSRFPVEVERVLPCRKGVFTFIKKPEPLSRAVPVHDLPLWRQID